MKKAFFNGKTIIFMLCLTIVGGYAINYEIDRYECTQNFGAEYCKDGGSSTTYSKEEIKKAKQIHDMINSIGN